MAGKHFFHKNYKIASKINYKNTSLPFLRLLKRTQVLKSNPRLFRLRAQLSPGCLTSHLRYCIKDFADISLKVIYIQSLTKESFIYKLQMFFSFLRILLCAMCGDEYPVELILGTMLQPHACYSNPEQQDTIMIEAMLGNVKKTIAVTLTSYHRKILLVFFRDVHQISLLRI